MTVTEKPQETWEEPYIAEFEDSESRRVLRGALLNRDTRRRIAMLAATNPKGYPVRVAYRAGSNPPWLSPGQPVRCEITEIMRDVVRCALPRREYPLDIYWEEMEWIEVGSRLPSVE